MKLTRALTLTAALMLTGGIAKAVHVWEDPGGWWSGAMTDDPTTPLYTANELSLDGFGSYVAGQRGIEHIFETSIRGSRGAFGGGIGVNYFFTRELGIGGDMNILGSSGGNSVSRGGNFVDQVAGSLILRFPIDPSGFAPYIFGGGGRLTNPGWSWEGHAGVGIEYRLNPVIGIFSDARYLWVDNSSLADRLYLRAGLRFVF
ncbi:MAG: hypothetical protein QOJ40_1050 [Verrucomicrobiota bacterium]